MMIIFLSGCFDMNRFICNTSFCLWFCLGNQYNQIIYNNIKKVNIKVEKWWGMIKNGA